LRGVVKDLKTGEDLIGATVAIKGTQLGVASDYEGTFLIKTTLKLPLTLVVSYTGYNSIEIPVKEIQKFITIKLSQNTKLLEEVKIIDTRVTERQKQAPLTIETMDAISIKETPAANFYEGLSHLKGVDMTAASIGFKIINTRGFNSTSPVRSLQLIDGVDNQAPGLNFSLGNFLGSSELDIQKVDLVVGASSAYFGPGAFNGVINMQTKNPFLFPGLTAQIKYAERNLFEGSFRYAQVYKDKDGKDRFAYKLNMFFMRANDWEATNRDATIQSPVNNKNPGRYDAVNTYGDEYSTSRFRQTGLIYLGYGYALREGYKETNLVDYNSRNAKLGASFHYKLKNQSELIYASNFGTGTTVYQGDNRFSLKEILFFQNRIELRKDDKYFIRIYATNEDAGKSYDPYSTAILLQNMAKTDENWAKDYAENWNRYIFNRLQVIRPTIGSEPPGVRYEDYANQYLYNKYYDSLVFYHWLCNSITDTSVSTRGGLPRLISGTPEFASALNSITSLSNREGGSRFFDNSALYHIAGEYNFKINGFDLISGGNFRLFAPYSKGTIFLDTAQNQRIYNYEFGTYLGLEHKFINNKLKLSLTNRLDKNQNFKLLWSPALTGVYTYKEHVFRFSATSAIRNPTLTDQYINLNVGRATLLGNLNGFDSLVTISSLISAFNSGRGLMEYFNVAAVKPEKVKTLEIGYRGNLSEKLFVDASYYYSWYNDFLGYKIGAKVDWPTGSPFVNGVKVYRVTTNSADMVTTQGFSLGLNYFYLKYLGFSGNFSWNKLDRNGSTDPLIPAYNTPEIKYNLGINGRNIDSKIGNFSIYNWGYSINYKWQDGFLFEGSPQFTGYVAAYDMVDCQVNKSFRNNRYTTKLGVSNVLNNKVYQVYGGPNVGRLIYFSVNFDFNSK